MLAKDQVDLIIIINNYLINIAFLGQGQNLKTKEFKNIGQYGQGGSSSASKLGTIYSY